MQRGASGAKVRRNLRNRDDERKHPERDGFDAACRQVGEFLYHFSLLEKEIDDGIGKLLGIGAGTIDVVTANIDFGRKVSVLRSAEDLKAAQPDEARRKLVKETFSAIMALNDKRKIVAHCPFTLGQEIGAVVFRRAVATHTLKVENIEWSDKDFRASFSEARRVIALVHQIVEEMQPYTPSLDFSDARNNMYLALL